MATYRKSAHTVHLLRYHFVFVTKYRKPALRGDIAAGVRDLIREICRSKDIEIILTVEGASGLKDFDKGDGILFLDDRLGLDLNEGENLICGDTASDVPMVKAAAEKSPDPWTIFVTRDENLKEAVRRASGRAHFVSEPDVLVCCLNQLGKERE